MSESPRIIAREVNRWLAPANRRWTISSFVRVDRACFQRGSLDGMPISAPRHRHAAGSNQAVPLQQDEVFRTSEEADAGALFHLVRRLAHRLATLGAIRNAGI